MYPNLIPNWALNKTVQIIIESSEINEYNEKEILLNETVKANVQFKTKQILTADKRLITVTGSVYFQGDIYKDNIITDGKIIIDNRTYKIYQGQKAYNFDGTVNYTEVDII